VSNCTCRRHAVCPYHLGILEQVVDAWEVIDRWWTDEPVRYSYRVIVRYGQQVTQRLAADGITWEAVPCA